MRTWYQFQAAATAGAPATVTIFDEIGYWGVTAKAFIDDLRKIDAKDLTVEINSPGGDVFAGIAIFNALKMSGKNVTTKVMGVAASAASLIAMAGSKIVMPENSFMMVHNPWSFAMGNADELRDQADTLDKIGASLVGTYAKRTGQTDEKIREMLSKDTWLTAAEAKELGFADEVVESVAAKAAFDLDRLPEAMRAAYANAQGEAPADEAPADDEPADEAPAGDEPADAQGSLFTDQVLALAKASGIEMYASVLATDERVTSVEAAQARATEIREIVALCAVAKKDGEAAPLINSRKSLADARAHLCAALAADSDKTPVDTTVRNSNGPSKHDVQPSAINPAAIWAARRQQQGVRK